MVHGDARRRTVGRGDDHLDLRVGSQACQAHHRDAVLGTDQVVVVTVGERERQHALLLEVGLVDPGEGAGHDGAGATEPRLHGGVLTR